MQRELVRERAFPTIGIILLGGLTDDITRFPRHPSAGIAYTSVDDGIYSETSIVESDTRIGLLDGNTVNDSYRSPFKILDRYRSVFQGYLESEDGKVGFISKNKGILSGSSDSGAAALGSAIRRIAPSVIDTVELENDLRVISESVGRSLFGGLTLTELHKNGPSTSRLLSPEYFSDFTVVGCSFPEKRKPSDTIHSNIVKSGKYPDRIESTIRKSAQLKELAASKDIEGIFELAQSDTDDYHALIESVGVNIINSDMRKFIKRIREIKKEMWCTYIVTGGTNVFVAVHKEEESAICEEAVKYNSKPTKLKVAGEPVNLFMASK